MDTANRRDIRVYESKACLRPVVPKGRALERALEIAAALSTYPQVSLRNDRRAALGGLALPLEEGLAFEAEAHRSSLADPQVAEWLKRFAAGERPQPLRPPEA